MRPYWPRYHLSAQGDAELQWQLKKALRNGWIQPSNSHYGSPVLCVPETVGGLPMWIKNRAADRIIWKDWYPLPVIEELVQLLGGLNFFHMIDIAMGSHHTRIYAGNHQTSAISTKYWLYEWMVLHFGPANALGHFMLVMNCLWTYNPRLGKFAAIYHHYTFIHCSMRQEHLYHMRIVLDHFHKAGLNQKWSKCK